MNTKAPLNQQRNAIFVLCSCLLLAVNAIMAGCSNTAPVPESVAEQVTSPPPLEQKSPQLDYDKEYDEWRAEQLKLAPRITSVDEYFQALEDGRPYLISDLSDMEYKIVADKLLEQYPLVSLRDRLAFEHRDGFLGDLPQKTREQIKADPEFRNGAGGASRIHALKDLHSDEVDRFVRNDGFGSGRMRGNLDTKNLLKLPSEFGEITQIPFDSRYLESNAVELPGAGSDFRKPTNPRRELIVNGLPVTEFVQATHTFVAEKFVDEDFTGWVKDIDNVAGFLPHRVRFDKGWDGRLGNAMTPSWFGLPQYEWYVNKLQLVSLLMHDEPVVYDSEKLPDMQTASDVPTRDLNEFESAALARIRAGESVVIHSTQNRILMMGRIWANAECAQCHRIRDDELLGAFSWELLRVPMADRNEGQGN